MIVPNLMVRDIARSVRYYRDTIGMRLTMTASPARQVRWPGEIDGASFAMLEWNDRQLMLQTVASLAGELDVFGPDSTPMPSGTIYFRGLHPDTVRDCVAPEVVVRRSQELPFELGVEAAQRHGGDEAPRDHRIDHRLSTRG